MSKTRKKSVLSFVEAFKLIIGLQLLRVAGLEKQITQEEDESSNDNEQVSAALRIRKTQHATTIHMLVEALAEFNAEQIDYKEKCEERMQKVVSIGKAIDGTLF